MLVEPKHADMSDDTAETTDPENCDHELDAEYLYPADAQILEIADRDGEPTFTVAVPCPECDQPLELTLTVESIEESALSLPLDDAEDVYD